MDLEITILSEVRERQIYDTTYMGTLKNDTNEYIYKTKIDSQTENKLMVTKGRREVGSIQSGFKIYTLLYMKLINSKDLLYSTRNYTCCPVIIYKVHA